MKTFEIFTDKHSVIIQADTISEAISRCWFEGIGHSEDIIAVVEKSHPIAKEFGIK